MVDVTQAYKNTMALPLRPPGVIEIDVEVIDVTAADDATASSTGGIWFSQDSTLMYDSLPETSYATLEPDRWVGDGEQLWANSPGDVVYPQGYVSEAVSDQNWSFASPPTVTFTFTEPHSFKGLTLWFDTTNGEYPEEIRVTAAVDGGGTLSYTGTPDTAEEYVLVASFDNVTSVTITWMSTRREYQRARLQRAVFGYFVHLGSNDLLTADWKWTVDPIGRRLPEQSLTFDMLDYEGNYDTDNPAGIWADMEERIPIRVRWGQVIAEEYTWGLVYEHQWSEIYRTTWRLLYEGGATQYNPVGLFYMDSLPSTTRRTASFTAVSLIDILDKTYIKGSWGSASLYDLATRVMEDMRPPKLLDGTDPWLFDDVLKTITTEAPLPIATGRELLQLIAVAACCVLYVDRDGVLRIEPVRENVEDFKLGLYYDANDLPHGTKDKALGGVRVVQYTYSDVQEPRELVNADYEVRAGETVEITFTNPVRDVTITSTGTFTSNVYAYAVELTFATAGTYNIAISGSRVDTTEIVVSDPVEDAREESAWCEYEANLLITDTARARAVAAWVKRYLLQRLLYEYEYRGNPELDVLDIIHAQSRFSEDYLARILEHNIHYNGAFSGEMLVKRMEGLQ